MSNNTAFQVSTFERSAGLNNTGEENGFFGPNTRGNSIGSINSFFGHRSVIDNTFEGSNSFLVQDLQETIFLGVSIFRDYTLLSPSLVKHTIKKPYCLFWR